MHRALIASLVALLAVTPLPARAQNCAGFTDVTVFNSFCTNVQWIKNRGITQGCGAGATYCPNDPVSRLQMAAFMNRLGNVLTPRVLSTETTGTISDLANPAFVCQTEDVQQVNYTREVHADGSFSFTPSNDGLLQLSVFYSFDSGATWQLAPLNDVVVTVGMTAGTRGNASLTLERKGFPFGGTGPTRFAIRVVRGSTLTSAALTDYVCQFQVVVTNAVE
jgi:hypothetical protein